MEKIRLLLGTIGQISFWQRLFGWGKIKTLLREADNEFSLLENRLNQLEKNYRDLFSEKQTLTAVHDSLKERSFKYESKIEQLEDRLRRTTSELDTIKAKREKEIEEHRISTDRMLQAENNFKDQLEKFRGEQHQKELDELEEMKLTWNRHEEDVETSIKHICQRHVVEYLDDVPFRGNPDNTLMICEEYIIFDAKSPKGNDLDNFPNYIREQTKSIKKYTSKDSVKKEIYLVVPTNTIEVLIDTVYDMGDYTVYVITKDSLEAVILSHKKIEEYEYIDKLSPEDRQTICRVLGKFFHHSKRRIEIDHSMTEDLIEILRRCEYDLPEEFYQSVVAFDKAEVVNPPADRRGKQVEISTLERKQERIEAEARIRGIA